MIRWETCQEQIATELRDQGWTIVDGLFDDELVTGLAEQCRNAYRDGQMKDAGVGQAAALEVRKSVRGDSIRWLAHGEAAVTDQFLDAMEQLRQLLNERLLLGLRETEHHFALYPPGAYYQRHRDQFRGDDRRVLSSILYLNYNWQSADGGALRMYLEDGQGNEKSYDIAPITNRLVLFLSEQIEHEVLPTTTERLSLTGWFRRA